MRPEPADHLTLTARCADTIQATRQFDIDPTPEAVRHGMKDILCEVNRLAHCTPAALSNIEIVLAEVLNNIVEHSYRSNAAGSLSVTIHLTERRVLFETRDGGVPMPGLIAPDPVQPDVDCELVNLPEGGFGWFMIRCLSRDLIYRRSVFENILEFSLDRYS